MRVWISVDGDVIELNAELARSDLARTRGLSYRPCILDGWGLLLEFPAAGAHQVTTRAMEFELDLAMVGEDGVVSAVHRGVVAGSSELYGAPSPVRVVLETPAGLVHIEPGARLEYGLDPEQL